MTLVENRWYRVDQTDNPEVRVYHSRLPLLPEGRGVQGMTKEHPRRDEIAPSLMLIVDIPGVSAAEVHAYCAIVAKSPVFTWSEIDEHMLSLLQGVPLAYDLENNEAPRPTLELVVGPYSIVPRTS